MNGWGGEFRDVQFEYRYVHTCTTYDYPLFFLILVWRLAGYHSFELFILITIKIVVNFCDHVPVSNLQCVFLLFSNYILLFPFYWILVSYMPLINTCTCKLVSKFTKIAACMKSELTGYYIPNFTTLSIIIII